MIHFVRWASRHRCAQGFYLAPAGARCLWAPRRWDSSMGACCSSSDKGPPLAQLAWEGKWETLNDVLRAGRKPNAAAELYKPPGYASAPGCTVHVLRRMHMEGRPARHRRPAGGQGGGRGLGGYGETALHRVALGGHAELVRALGGTHGADLNAQESFYGSTPLHYAASSGKTAAARALLELGADASLRNQDGQTALDFA